MKILVLGGDIRLHYTAERLKQKYEVYTYGVSELDMLPDEP